MATTLHAHVPQQDSLYDSFYYDEEWMTKWHKATSRQKPSCAGAKYYSFLDTVFDKKFIKMTMGLKNQN